MDIGRRNREKRSRVLSRVEPLYRLPLTPELSTPEAEKIPLPKWQNPVVVGGCVEAKLMKGFWP